MEVGDVVQLKSGGPHMTVEFFRDDSDDSAVCTWMDGAKPMQRTFKKLALEVVPPFDPNATMPIA